MASGQERRSPPPRAQWRPRSCRPWRGRIVFARVYERKRDFRYLYVRSRTGTEPSRRLRGGLRGVPGPRCAAHVHRQHALGPDGPGPVRARLGFGWAYQGDAEGLAHTLRVDDVTSPAHRRVDSFGGGGLTDIDVGFPGFRSAASTTGACAAATNPAARDAPRSCAPGTPLRIAVSASRWGAA